jgi:glycosyltransferase involved in cell wall biosynthesis/predicted GH43/DUF377 family glycosyl hydrolase
MPKHADLCLNMIVKDEAAIVERLIDSVAPHVRYYVVCDTGSGDDTVERVRTRFYEHGIDGEIYSIPFLNFSQARNCALDHGRASKGKFDYFLLADADMELVVDDANFACDLSKPAYSVKQESRSLGYYNTRIIRKDVSATYIGPTHEYLQVSDTTRLPGVGFLDHECGASRVHKIARDLNLLLEALEENPDDSRTMFYLAQTCYDAGRFREAADWYELCIRADGSAEERWYARYQMALCHLALRNDGRFVSTCLQAYDERPWRIEPLYQLARYHRLEGMHETAKFFLKEAQTKSYPSTDNLFINEEIFRTGINEELSYTGLSSDTPDLHEPGRQACFALATSPTASSETIAAARFNSVSYAISASEMFSEFEARIIDLIPPEGYCALNPSVATHDLSLRCIVRASNFTECSSANDIVYTQNFLVDLNENFEIKSAKDMVDLSGRTTYATTIQGYEDCRLFFLSDAWWCTATVRNDDPQADCKIALLALDAAGAIVDVHVLQTPERIRSMRSSNVVHEKNWVPLIRDDELYFVYSSSPTVILKCNPQTGQITEWSVKESRLRLHHLRGGSQAIRVDGGWMYVTHEVVQYSNDQTRKSERSYLHRFVLLDENFVVSAITDPFFFLNRGIEFCAGLTLQNDKKQLIVSFGSNDRQAQVGCLNLERVRSRLRAL